MPTIEEVKKMAAEMHDQRHGARVGHVSQVWEDGEITSQKCGALLGLRTLHCVRRPVDGIYITMPVRNASNRHSFAMVESLDHAFKLRAAMVEATIGAFDPYI